MRKIKILVSYEYELEIDDDNYCVKDYEDDIELLVDCAHYSFGTALPVINTGGVVVKNRVVYEVEKIQDK